MACAVVESGRTIIMELAVIFLLTIKRTYNIYVVILILSHKWSFNQNLIVVIGVSLNGNKDSLLIVTIIGTTLNDHGCTSILRIIGCFWITVTKPK